MKGWRQRRRVPEGLARELPEASLVARLMEFDKKIDSVLSRPPPSMEFGAVLKPYTDDPRTLRLVIYNTNFQGSCTLHIDGGLLPVSSEDQGASASWAPDLAMESAGGARPLSSFLRRISVHVDPSQHPFAEPVMLWGKDGSGAITASASCVETGQGGFEVTWAGEGEVEVMVSIEVEHVPPVFALSPALEGIAGQPLATYSRLTRSLWEYVTSQSRQLVVPDTGDVVRVACDSELYGVFGVEQFEWTELPRLLEPHLRPPDPIVIDYRTVASPSGCFGGSTTGATSYCIPVMCDDVLDAAAAQATAGSVLRGPGAAPSDTGRAAREIEALDERIDALMLRALAAWQRRRRFLCFARDPVRSCVALTASEMRNGPTSELPPERDPDEERRSSFYQGPRVSAAVRSFMSKVAPTRPPAVQPQTAATVKTATGQPPVTSVPVSSIPTKPPPAQRS